MTLLIAAIAASGFGLSVTLLARAVALPRSRPGPTLERVEQYGFGGVGAASTEKNESVLDEAAASLGGLVAGRLESFQEQDLRMQLVGAGLYDVSPRKFLGYRLLSAIGLGALWLFLAVTINAAGAIVIVGLLFGVLGGWLLPVRWLKQRAKARHLEIDYELPELIDLLIVTVEAGLGFVGSLQMAAGRLEGPLGQELRLTLQEMRFGLSTNDALLNTMRRCDTPSMRSFVRAVVQGETLGVSIGQILRDMAHEMRRRRKQQAEERAQKAPVKILFPLVFLIFPAMFVVLLGPALFLLLKALKGGA